MADTEFTHPQTTLSYGDAIGYTERWLDEKCLTPEDRAAGFIWKIEDYFDGDGAKLKERPWAGVRVAEVGYHNQTGGGSYMQVDQPWGIAFCGQVERCVLALIEGWNEDEDDGTDEEFERLAYLIEQTNKPTLDREEIRQALEGDSNDAEHDALAAVAEALNITYNPPED